MSKRISLEAARVLAGLSQKEAAEKFSVNYQTLASWEKDSNKMKQKYVQMIPSIYYVNISDIFFGTKNEFTSYFRKKT
ncbi:Cro-like protein phage associated [Enterococcus mundtii QU 25]|uniref:helix-turn-helix transcriptional regulator n=1 Tax=Enterococcus mundtii TaxID=53346 RepID=UPI0003C5549C|nr:helix-turn-helix transcriptional regulator [Enterococcus mundtii]BAO06314.1 Cro-like protein phage associated [Enterococcus mundtii QU 25]